MNNVMIPVDTYNKLMEYIVKRPYYEVKGLIEEVSNAARTCEPSPEAAPVGLKVVEDDEE